MARTRLIYPEAPVDDDVVVMSLAARYVWAYLPCHADREGRLADKPLSLKAAILPSDPVDMSALLDELAQANLITRYLAAGKRCIQIRNFASFQKPHPRESHSDLPPPTKGGVPKDNLGSPKADLGQAKDTPRLPVSDPVSDPVSGSGENHPPAPACDPSEPKPVMDAAAREAISEAMRSALQEPTPVTSAVGWRPRVFIAAASPAFLACFERYPNGDGQSPAAQIWQEIALTFDGGEAALKAAILARFDAGMLKRNPYNQARYCPKFERFLSERRWEDREPKPDDPAARDGPARSRDQPAEKPKPYAILSDRKQTA